MHTKFLPILLPQWASPWHTSGFAAVNPETNSVTQKRHHPVFGFPWKCLATPLLSQYFPDLFLCCVLFPFFIVWWVEWEMFPTGLDFQHVSPVGGTVWGGCVSIRRWGLTERNVSQSWEFIASPHFQISWISRLSETQLRGGVLSICLSVSLFLSLSLCLSLSSLLSSVFCVSYLLSLPPSSRSLTPSHFFCVPVHIYLISPII